MHIVVISFLLGASGAYLISRYATVLGLVDIPNERSSHHIPTPRGGGIGICATVLFASVYCHIPWAIAISSFVLSIASFIDDRQSIHVIIRFFIQLVCAANILCFLHPYHFSLITFLTYGLFWIIFITGTANFYNFMDGIDGISGLTGITAFGALASMTYMLHYPTNEVIFNASIAAACLGFLPFNIVKAKIFMGDVGSVVLGFLFAAQVYRYSSSFNLFLLFACFLFLFYIDGVTTLIVRLKDGEKLTQAHRRHLYQILSNQLKYPHWKVTMIYGILQVIVSASIIFGFRFNLYVMIIILSFWLLIFLLVSFSIRERVVKTSP